MAKASIPTSRVSRGIALFEEYGDEIVRYLDGTFGVPSRTDEGVVYVVDLEAETCECKDFEIRRVGCMHQAAATIKAAKPTSAAAPRRAAVPARRCSKAPSMESRQAMASAFLSRMDS